MESSGLQSLIDLLNHRYLVRKRLAEMLYKETSQAAYTRLNSRATGKHRFQKDEMKTLIRIFRSIAKKLDRYGQKLQQADSDKKIRSAIDSLIQIAELNLKPVIETAVGAENYYPFYDRVRLRGHFPEDWSMAVAIEVQSFAAHIIEHCEEAQKKGSQYPFSFGKGRVSHLE